MIRQEDCYGNYTACHCLLSFHHANKIKTNSSPAGEEPVERTGRSLDHVNPCEWQADRQAVSHGAAHSGADCPWQQAGVAESLMWLNMRQISSTQTTVHHIPYNTPDNCPPHTLQHPRQLSTTYPTTTQTTVHHIPLQQPRQLSTTSQTTVHHIPLQQPRQLSTIYPTTTQTTVHHIPYKNPLSTTYPTTTQTTVHHIPLQQPKPLSTIYPTVYTPTTTHCPPHTPTTTHYPPHTPTTT